jgi:hypothetical protein
MAINYYTSTRKAGGAVPQTDSPLKEHSDIGNYYGIVHAGGTMPGPASVSRFPYKRSLYGKDWTGSVSDHWGNAFAGNPIGENYVGGESWAPSHFDKKGAWYGYSPLGKLMQTTRDRQGWGSNRADFITEYQKEIDKYPGESMTGGYEKDTGETVGVRQSRLLGRAPQSSGVELPEKKLAGERATGDYSIWDPANIAQLDHHEFADVLQTEFDITNPDNIPTYLKDADVQDYQTLHDVATGSELDDAAINAIIQEAKNFSDSMVKDDPSTPDIDEGAEAWNESGGWAQFREDLMSGNLLSTSGNPIFGTQDDEGNFTAGTGVNELGTFLEDWFADQLDSSGGMRSAEEAITGTEQSLWEKDISIAKEMEDTQSEVRDAELAKRERLYGSDLASVGSSAIANQQRNAMLRNARRQRTTQQKQINSLYQALKSQQMHLTNQRNIHRTGGGNRLGSSWVQEQRDMGGTAADDRKQWLEEFFLQNDSLFRGAK